MWSHINIQQLFEEEGGGKDRYTNFKVQLSNMVYKYPFPPKNTKETGGEHVISLEGYVFRKAVYCIFLIQ